MKQLLKYTLPAIAAIATLFAGGPATVKAESTEPVKYVFLFVGDGMSIPQRMMTDDYLRRRGEETLFINTMPHQAVNATRSANSFITDSAASGTAIACGEKTNNGRIGMDSTGNIKFESVAEVAHKNGRKVGIVTSVTLNHATPAAFYAHNTSRGNAYEIGLDLVNSGFEYFGGGGVAKHNDKKHPDYKGDIYELAEEAGYIVSRTPEEFANIKAGDAKVISLGAPGALPYAIDMQDSDLRLADFTRQGIEVLDNPKGFFMMVEGGKIDWMCHANDAATTVHEVIDFDNSVKVAYEFALKHPGETLIVVTGDHETGGLTLGFAGTGYNNNIQNLSAQTKSQGEMIRDFKEFNGTDFEELKPIITEMSGLIFAKDGEREKGALNLTEIEEKTLEDTFAKNLDGDKIKGVTPMANAVIKLLNNKCGIGWTSGSHTALPVSTTSYGARAELFASMQDNTDIAIRLKKVVK